MVQTSLASSSILLILKIQPCLFAGPSQAYGQLKYAKIVSCSHTRLLDRSLGNISFLIFFKPCFQSVIQWTSFTKNRSRKYLGRPFSNCRVIFLSRDSFQATTAIGNPGSLSRNIGKFRSENLPENGNKNRCILPCGELLLSLDDNNSPHGKLHRFFISIF